MIYIYIRLVICIYRYVYVHITCLSTKDQTPTAAFCCAALGSSLATIKQVPKGRITCKVPGRYLKLSVKAMEKPLIYPRVIQKVVGPDEIEDKLASTHGPVNGSSSFDRSWTESLAVSIGQLAALNGKFWKWLI